MSETQTAVTEDRTVPASLSSEQPVERWFGSEVLVHDAAIRYNGRTAGGGWMLASLRKLVGGLAMAMLAVSLAGFGSRASWV